VKSDGTIWFTDPTYGIMSDYEGHKSEPEQEGCHVYCVDPGTGEIRIVADDFVKPNGLAFSPDESRLFIADSGFSHDPDGPHHIRVFDVSGNNMLKGGEVFVEVAPGVPDGFRFDTEGNLWSSAQDGVRVFDWEGIPLGSIKLPKMVSNLTFGGPKRNRLFITCTDMLCSVFVGVNGAQRP
jgi:gluconolactonase